MLADTNGFAKWAQPPIFAARLKKRAFRGTRAQVNRPDVRHRYDKQAQSGT